MAAGIVAEVEDEFVNACFFELTEGVDQVSIEVHVEAHVVEVGNFFVAFDCQDARGVDRGVFVRPFADEHVGDGGDCGDAVGAEYDIVDIECAVAVDNSAAEFLIVVHGYGDVVDLADELTALDAFLIGGRAGCAPEHCEAKFATVVGVDLGAHDEEARVSVGVAGSTRNGCAAVDVGVPVLTFAFAPVAIFGIDIVECGNAVEHLVKEFLIVEGVVELELRNLFVPEIAFGHVFVDPFVDFAIAAVALFEDAVALTEGQHAGFGIAVDFNGDCR